MGLWQIEPDTHRDVYQNFLEYREGLYDQVMGLSASGQTFQENLTICSMVRPYAGSAIIERLRPCLMRVTLRAEPAIGNATTIRRWALDPRGITLPKSKKRSAPATPKPRDPNWKMRRALGHKVEPDPKAYKRREKHTKPLAEDEPK